MQNIGRSCKFLCKFLCVCKKICLTILMVQFLIFFSLLISLKMSDRFETYGSADIRTSFLNDERGKLIKSDSLFKNLYDYWTCLHASGAITSFVWYHPKIAKLEMIIRRKWVTTKDLLLVNIVLKKFEKRRLF